MSSGKLVSTTFSSGPDDELAVVDVYGTSTSAIVNSWQEFDSAAVDAVDKAVESSVADIGKDIDNALKDLSNDPLGEFIEGLSKGKGLPTIASLKKELGNFGGIGPFKSLSSDILGSIKNIAGGDVSAAMCRVEDYASKNMDFASMSGGSFSLDDVAKDLTNGKAQVLSLIKDLPKPISMALTGGFNVNQIKQKVFASVGTTVTQLVPGATSSDARVVTDIMNSISNGCYNVGINSTGGLAAMLSGLGYLGSLFGLPNAFSAMSNCLNNNNLTLAAAGPLLNRAIGSGNLGLLKDLASSSASSSLRSMAPGLIRTMSTNFQKPADLSQQDYPRKYQELRSTYNTLVPDWDTYKRNGGSIIDITKTKDNDFISELMTSQLNEIMHPNNYLSNIQQIFPATGAYTSSTAVAGVTSDSVVMNANQTLDSTNVTAGTGITTSAAEALAAINNTVTRITSFDNEPFMLLGKVYPDTSVESDLNSYFPEFSSGLSESLTTFET